LEIIFDRKKVIKMDFTKIVGIISGLLTSISMLPQFFKLIKTKDSKNISMGMLVVLLMGVAGWVYYGFLRTDWIIIATNTFAFLVNFVTMILAIKYRRH
jgi:MtN3 and saliva related transmembrane protein